MTSMTIRVAAVAAMVLTAATACAAERGAMREACRADARKLCSGVERGQGRIVACLREKSSELSDGCRGALQQAAGRQGGAGQEQNGTAAPAGSRPDGAAPAQ